MSKIIMSTEDENKEKQSSIVVPIDDELDKVSSDSPNTVDELAMELATIKQSSKKIAFIKDTDVAQEDEYIPVIPVNIHSPEMFNEIKKENEIVTILN